MEHTAQANKKRARRLDPARQSERYTWIEPGPQAATAWSRHKVQLPRFGGRPSAVIRSIGAKDQLNGVVFGSSVACRHPLGLEMAAKKKIVNARPGVAWMSAPGLSNDMCFFGRQKASGGRGNGERQWTTLPILMLMRMRMLMLMPNDGQVDGQEEVQ